MLPVFTCILFCSIVVCVVQPTFPLGESHAMNHPTVIPPSSHCCYFPSEKSIKKADHILFNVLPRGFLTLKNDGGYS